MKIMAREDGMAIVSIRVGAAALAASALLLAGCTPAADPQPGPTPAPSAAGVEELTGEQIMEEARVAFAGARSYVFEGSRTVDGVKVLGRYRMVNGATTGTMSMGGRITRFTIGEDQYLLPDDGFWEILATRPGMAEAKRKAAGQWVRMNTSDVAVERLLGRRAIIADLEPDGPLVKGKVFGSGGEYWIDMTSGTDPRWRAGVATTGKPYPHHWTTATSQIDLTNFDTEFPEITPPAENEVVDLRDLTN
ncbi:hypothetical protein [Actinoplanes subglobosus]|uniref:Lipoprotein n=1 Tax=Actinoplanes subglobosus TaxID=1547892 RepID=A0ABV8IU65_9ACTN